MIRRPPSSPLFPYTPLSRSPPPSLGAAKLFPPLVIHLIASGEATGRLDTMLARAAEAQARELENWIRGLTALLEPLLILARGRSWLFTVVAILLPLFDMNHLVR